MNPCPTGPTGPPGVTGSMGAPGVSNIALRYDNNAIWVAPNGNDATMETGNINRPASTIQFALNALASGMTLYVFGGDYSSQGTITMNGNNNKIVGLSNPIIESLIVSGSDVRLTGFIINDSMTLESLTTAYIDTCTIPLVTIGAVCSSVRVERCNLSEVTETTNSGMDNYIINNIFRSTDNVLNGFTSSTFHALVFKDNIIFVDPTSQLLRFMTTPPGQSDTVLQSNLIIAEPNTSLDIIIDSNSRADGTSIVNLTDRPVVVTAQAIGDVLTKTYTHNVTVNRELSGTIQMGVVPLSHAGKIDVAGSQNNLTGTVIITTSPSTFTLPPASDGRIIELIPQGLPGGLTGVTVNGGNIIRGSDSFTSVVTSVALTGEYAKFQYSLAGAVWVLAMGPNSGPLFT
uniref:DUF1565 domain-containing protein n=1 Tax=viral metagenome TaxID=1070528 RepID=A0A6C0BM70_9ZZZZ